MRNKGKTHQIIGQTAQDVLQASDDRRLAVFVLADSHIELERPAEHEQHAAHTVMQVQSDPCRQLVSESRWADTGGTDTTTLACRLQFGRAKLVDTLSVNQLVVSADSGESAADSGPEEVVGAEGVDAHVSAHGDELRARQVVQCEVVIEEPGNVDNVLGCRGLSGYADL